MESHIGSSSGEDRLVGWVGELAQGVGLPAHHLQHLLAGVEDAVRRAFDRGTRFESVKVFREGRGFEVQLLGSSERELFLLRG